MPDEYTIAADAAEQVIKADIAAHVPAMFQGRIPADVPRKMAEEIAHAVVDALHAAAPVAQKDVPQ